MRAGCVPTAHHGRGRSDSRFRRAASIRIATLRRDGREALSAHARADPGPSRGARRAGEPVIHHRSPDFKAVFAETRARLQEVYRTENEVLVFTASGTGAFESAVANLLSPGERVLAVSHGELRDAVAEAGDRVRLRRGAARLRLGRDARGRRTSRARSREQRRRGRVPRPLGDLDRCRLRHRAAGRRLQRRGRDLGRRRDLEPRRRAARDRRVGRRRRRHRLAEGADDPAGPGVRVRLRPCARRRRSRRRARASTGTGRGRTRQQQKDNTPFTPPTSTIVALNAALRMILRRGARGRLRAARRARPCLPRRARRRWASSSTRPTTTAPPSLTAILTPAGVDAVELRLALRDRFGITIAGGHGDVVDRLFRIGHIGYVDVFDITHRRSARSSCSSSSMGATVERGAAVAAALDGVRVGR